jgi:predicted esterase
MIESHSIQVERTARYYTLGTAGPSTQQFWIACHGYGQLAERLISKFRDLDTDRQFVLAPEGLSKFYWKGVSGDVGASWMTKKDRLDEIRDYCAYLQHLYTHYRQQLPSDVQINLFGFSQGCATICRWALQEYPEFHHLILWAGVVPDDLHYPDHHDYFKNKKLRFYYGTQDEYLTPDRLQQYKDFLKAQDLEVDIHSFEGPHAVDRSLLTQIANQLMPGT